MLDGLLWLLTTGIVVWLFWWQFSPIWKGGGEIEDGNYHMVTRGEFDGFLATTESRRESEHRRNAMPRKNESGKQPKTLHRTVEVMDSSYQPSKAELEEDVSIDASPEDVGRALMQTVDVRRVTPEASTPKRGKKK